MCQCGWRSSLLLALPSQFSSQIYFDCSAFRFSSRCRPSVIASNSFNSHIFIPPRLRSPIRHYGRRRHRRQRRQHKISRSTSNVWPGAFHVGVSLCRFAALCLFRLNWKRSQQLFRCRFFEIFIFELMHTADSAANFVAGSILCVEPSSVGIGTHRTQSQTNLIEFENLLTILCIVLLY